MPPFFKGRGPFSIGLANVNFRCSFKPLRWLIAFCGWCFDIFCHLPISLGTLKWHFTLEALILPEFWPIDTAIWWPFFRPRSEEGSKKISRDIVCQSFCCSDSITFKNVEIMSCIFWIFFFNFFFTSVWIRNISKNVWKKLIFVGICRFRRVPRECWYF